MNQPSPMDYRQIGQALASHLNRSSGVPTGAALQGMIADLAADHPELLLPMRDLVSRPAFQSIIAKANSGGGMLQRDALINEVRPLFSAPVLEALSELLNGFLNLPSPTNQHQAAAEREVWNRQRPPSASPQGMASEPDADTPPVAGSRGSLLILPKALPVGAILKSGWAAFAKAPFLFIGFTLLGGALNLGSQFIQDQASKSIQDGSGLGLAWILIFLLGFSLNIVASLWLNIGLFRGAWRALGGEKPIFKDFVNWHGKSITRLFMMTLFLVAVNMVVLAIAFLAGGLLSLIRLELLFIPLVIAVFTMIYLAVTQMFHVPLVVARGDKPMLAFKEGRRSVDPQFWPVLGFGILMILIGLTGLLLCGVGILVAAPVIVCCLVAAYQHLFDSEDQTGFLINLSKG